jgi:hypothetical protein
MDPNELRKHAEVLDTTDWLDARSSELLRQAADEIERLKAHAESTWKLADRFANAGREVLDFLCAEAEKAGEGGAPIVVLNLANLVHLIEAGRTNNDRPERVEEVGGRNSGVGDPASRLVGPTRPHPATR